jgi:hypothetical protein
VFEAAVRPLASLPKLETLAACLLLSLHLLKPFNEMIKQVVVPDVGAHCQHNFFADEPVACPGPASAVCENRLLPVHWAEPLEELLELFRPAAVLVDEVLDSAQSQFEH